MSEARDVRRRLRWRMLEKLASWAMLRMAKLAYRDGDLHEINHLGAQLRAGDTTDCGPDCPLRKPQPAAGEETR